MLLLKTWKTITSIDLINRSIFAKLCFINRTTPKPKLCYFFPQDLSSVALHMYQVAFTVLLWYYAYVKGVADMEEATQAVRFCLEAF